VRTIGVVNVVGAVDDIGEIAQLVTGEILGKCCSPTSCPLRRSRSSASTPVPPTTGLKTANALGITVPLRLIDRADEVIE
jgi:hypothetical protein